MRGSGNCWYDLHRADLGVVVMARNSETVAGEYGWGPGLTPPGLENAPLSEGGRYRGKTPPMGDPAGLRALADELAARGRA